MSLVRAVEYSLLCIYIGTIALFLGSLILLAIKGVVLLPRKWVVLLLTYFASLAFGTGVLLGSELVAPYNANFYQNPFLFLIYLGSVDCAMLAVFLLVVDMDYKHVPRLPLAGELVCITVIAFLILSWITLLNSTVTKYPWATYMALECTIGLGIAAFILLARRSFKDSKETERLTRETRRGFLAIASLAVVSVCGLAFLAWGMPFVDFSVQFNLYLTIWWLSWMDGSSVMVLVTIHFSQNLW